VDNHTERGAGGRQYGTSEKDKQTLTGQNSTSAARLGTVEERSSQLARSREFAGIVCHLAGGELDQIQFLLGHASVQTTEHYLGCKQKLRHAVNDNLGLEDI